MGTMVKVLAIFLCSGNSIFAPSGWFMHAWSHIRGGSRNKGKGGHTVAVERSMLSV